MDEISLSCCNKRYTVFACSLQYVTVKLYEEQKAAALCFLGSILSYFSNFCAMKWKFYLVI